LINEADEFADSDRDAKELVVLRNKLETLLKNTQKAFTKFGGLLSQNDQDLAEHAFAEAEAANRGTSVQDINKALTTLERTASQLTIAMMNPTPDATTTEV
jgi:molecular chaperone DnaK